MHQERFNSIIAWARKTNPYYARTIVDPFVVPILNRRAFQECNDEILNGYEANGKTSGATLTRVCVHINPERSTLDSNFIKMMVMHMGGALPRVDLIYPRGAQDPPFLLSILAPVNEQLDFIRKHYRLRNAVALITYPSNAVLLAREIIDQGLDFRFIKRVGLISEAVFPQQTAIIRQAFPNARQWSSYSATEVGLIAFQCPYEPQFHHAMTNKLGIEILDDQGNACEPRKVGRVVLTDYSNRQTPIIRYEIGDLAAFDTCPCGRIDAPALVQIAGKVRGTLLHRDGHRVLFLDLSIDLAMLPGIKQYQVLQHLTDFFTVRLVGSPVSEDVVRAIVEKHFGTPLRLRIEYYDEIPRDANGKFYASVSEV